MANKIALALANDLEKKRFLSLFKIIGPRLSSQWVVSNVDEADFIVIDQDHSSLEAHQYQLSYPRSRVVVYAEKAPPKEVLHIPKPLRASGLIGFLNQIYGPGLKPLSFLRKEPSDTSFAPGQLLARIRLNRCSALWRLEETPVFAHCYEQNKVLVHRNLFDLLSEKDAAFVHGCIQSGVRCNARSIQALGESEEFLAYSVYQFTWMCYLMLSHGVLHRDITDNTRLRLLRWPEFTRLVHAPKDLVLTAALTKRPFTVNQLVEETCIDRRRVIGFVNACHAIGQLKVEHASADCASEPGTETKGWRCGRSELLGKIMRRITGVV